jgi:hypothetical protein
VRDVGRWQDLRHLAASAIVLVVAVLAGCGGSSGPSEAELEAGAAELLQQEIEKDPAGYWGAYSWCYSHGVSYASSDEAWSVYVKTLDGSDPLAIAEGVGCGDGYSYREPRVPDPYAP